MSRCQRLTGTVYIFSIHSDSLYWTVWLKYVLCSTYILCVYILLYFPVVTIVFTIHRLTLYLLCFLQFYLQDTKSSNGTFINSQRLSRGSEESPPCEVLSGDTIQFGVDVTENTRKGTHTHTQSVWIVHIRVLEGKPTCSRESSLSVLVRPAG